jgi:hypothetical protein
MGTLEAERGKKVTFHHNITVNTRRIDDHFSVR